MHESMATIISDTALKIHCNEIFTLNEKRLIQFQISFFGLKFNIMIIILQHGHFDNMLQYDNKVIGNEC